MAKLPMPVERPEGTEGNMDELLDILSEFAAAFPVAVQYVPPGRRTSVKTALVKLRSMLHSGTERAHQRNKLPAIDPITQPDLYLQWLTSDD